MTEISSDDLAIRLEGVWKHYGLLPAIRDRWRIWRGTLAPDERDRWALRDINLAVRQGEILGILGRNGAGKSTLLKVLAGVTPVTRGHFDIRGRVFPMIELNAGLHPDLTGKENVFLLGSIMGLSRGEVTAKLGAIEAFCDIGEWFDRPVRQYSSGMLARLGFAVAVNVDADILLIDEVLSVGDLAFRNKCLQRLEALHSEGRSLLLVSHNLHTIRRACDKVAVLEKGEVAFFGHSEEAIERYEALLRTVNIDCLSDYGGFNFVGAQLDLVQLLNGDGQPQTSFLSGGEIALEFDLSVSQPLHQVTLNVVVESVEAIPVVWETLQLDALETGRHHFRLVWHTLHLKAGRYSIRIGMAEGEFPMKAFRVPNAVQLHIEGDILKRGLYVPPVDFTHCGRA